MASAEIERLRFAYQVLCLPTASTAGEIKRAYWRFAKEWHPDKWPVGTREHVDATERMREINLAFESIRHAPLRYHIAGHPRVAARAAAEGRPVRRETVPLTWLAEGILRWLLWAVFLGLCIVPRFYDLGIPKLLQAVLCLIAFLVPFRWMDAFFAWLISKLFRL